MNEEVESHIANDVLGGKPILVFVWMAEKWYWDFISLKMKVLIFGFQC